MENKSHIVLPEGTRDSIVWEFDGIRMGHALSNFNRLTSFSTDSTITDVVRLHIGLKGNYSFYYNQLDTHYHLIGGHANIMYSKEFGMTVENRTLELETFGVMFPRELFLRITGNGSPMLQEFGDAVIAGKDVMLSDQWGAVTPAIQEIISLIQANRFAGDIQNIFLLSKAVELLVLCAESCQMAINRKDAFITSRRDKEKILACRDLINERVHCPPSLSEISQTIGLNEFKLKRGFKETFHNTVFGYLTEQRLLLARQYLQDTPKTAAEIAHELGYSTPQHFNNAFKRRFGQTPSGLRKNP